MLKYLNKIRHVNWGFSSREQIWFVNTVSQISIFLIYIFQQQQQQNNLIVYFYVCFVVVVVVVVVVLFYFFINI